MFSLPACSSGGPITEAACWAPPGCSGRLVLQLRRFRQALPTGRKPPLKGHHRFKYHTQADWFPHSCASRAQVTGLIRFFEVSPERYQQSIHVIGSVRFCRAMRSVCYRRSCTLIRLWRDRRCLSSVVAARSAVVSACANRMASTGELQPITFGETKIPGFLVGARKEDPAVILIQEWCGMRHALIIQPLGINVQRTIGVIGDAGGE
jgi:hypothetical protein